MYYAAVEESCDLAQVEGSYPECDSHH
jgi:hypothetical protein